MLLITIKLNELPGHFLGAPSTGDAGGAGRAVVQHVAAVAFVHDLTVVGHFADVRSVVVESHVAHQKDLAVLDVTRERAVDLTAHLTRY